MATDLILPQGLRPSNLHLRPSVRVRHIDSDLYDICERIKHIDESLYIVEMAEGSKHAFAIMEDCRDGQQRLVFKVHVLDARVLHKLQEIMAKPLHERIAELDAVHHRIEEQERENELEDLYERIGRPMWTELERCGFIQRPVSYPKTGVTGGRGSLAKAG